MNSELEEKRKQNQKFPRSCLLNHTSIKCDYILSTLQYLVEETRYDHPSIPQLLTDYQNSLENTKERLCCNSMVELMHHLHLMFPFRYRLDCLGLYNKVIHHKYVEKFEVYWTMISGHYLALSVNTAGDDICLTELKGRVQPHQKWMTGRYLVWSDPVTLQQKKLSLTISMNEYTSLIYVICIPNWERGICM